MVALRALLLTSSLCDTGAFRFLSVGDWGAKVNNPDRVLDQSHVANAMDAIAAKVLHNQAFIVGAGDNFYQCGLSEDAGWTAVFDNMFNGAHLSKYPWYHVLGNHDYAHCGSPAAQIAWTARDPRQRWKMPDYHYAQRFVTNSGTGTLFALDSNVCIARYKTGHFEPNSCGGPGGENNNCFEQNSGSSPSCHAQLVWLKDAVAAAKANKDFLILVMHHPLPLLTKGEEGQKTVNFIVNSGFDLVISGHYHLLMHYKYRGIHGYISGAGCLGDEAPEEDEATAGWCKSSESCEVVKSFGTLGFMGHNMDYSNSKVVTKFYDHNANRLYTTSQPRQSLSAAKNETSLSQTV